MCFAELVLVEVFGNPQYDDVWKYRPKGNLIAIVDKQDTSDWNEPIDERIKSFRLYLTEKYDLHLQYFNRNIALI